MIKNKKTLNGLVTEICKAEKGSVDINFHFCGDKEETKALADRIALSLGDQKVYDNCNPEKEFYSYGIGNELGICIHVFATRKDLT